MKKLLVLSIILGLTGCFPLRFLHNGKYDFNFYGLEQSRKLMARIEGSLYRIEATAQRKIGEDGEPQKEIQPGIAFSIDGNYLLTLRHVVKFDPTMKVVTDPFGRMVMEIETKLMGERIFLWIEDLPNFPFRYELSCGTNESDIAILWGDNWKPQKLPIRIGDSNELEVGQALILSTTPGMKGHSWQLGNVASITAFKDTAEMMGNPENGFMLGAPINSGDSGNPVFALRDGVMELVGITQGKYSETEQVGWALKINYVLEEVKKLIKNKAT